VVVSIDEIAGFGGMRCAILQRRRGVLRHVMGLACLIDSELTKNRWNLLFLTKTVMS
jgi:hypothetical protein